MKAAPSMMVTRDEYLDARGTLEAGTLAPRWLDEEMLGRVRSDKVSGLVVVSPAAVSVIERLNATRTILDPPPGFRG